ncbi:MAG: D-alanyl-D-alanine carboxypeptidase family protein [Lachnospira sp.]
MKGSRRMNMRAGAVITIICAVVIVVFVITVIIKVLNSNSRKEGGKSTSDIQESQSETLISDKETASADEEETKESETSASAEEITQTSAQSETQSETQPVTKDNSQSGNQTQTGEAVTVIGKSSKGYDIVVKDGITYVKDIMIVNKTYSLPSTYNPGGLLNYVSAAFETMKSDAAAQGLNIWNQSGFRTYERQQELYNYYVSRDGKALADTYSARPGHSEHQSGLCMDLNSITDNFTTTKECEWVASHAHEYGFIVRFPEGKESVTGYKYESWHLRYVGKDVAKQIYESGECLEEYLGITSVYPD